MRSLFISTYNEFITIALLSNGKVINIKEVQSVKSHSIYLIPTIELVLKEENIDTKDLEEVVVINGPGSFTGVRLGVTVAKTLAYTLNIPIKTITTLDALAFSDDNLNKKIVFIKDNKGSFYGIYSNNKLLEKIKYLSAFDFENFLDQENGQIEFGSAKLNIDKIYENIKDNKNELPHEVKAVYIKEIEVLNGN